MPQKSPPAPKQQLHAFFATLERELDKVEFFRPPDKRDTMLINLRNIFHRMQPTQQDIQTLHGVIMAIAEGRKGPARGGLLDGDEAAMLRALLAEHGKAAGRARGGAVRGLSRLLRRNPTDAERALWDALIKDRRFAGQGFKRQTPVGPHVTDLVSFPLRAVIELVPADESEAVQQSARERRAWLAERGYRVIDVQHGRGRGRRRRRRSTGSPRRSALQHLDLRGGAGAQEARGRCRPRGSGCRAWRRPTARSALTQ